MYRRGRIWYISVGGVRRSAETTDRERAKALEHKLNAEAWDRRNGLIVPTWDQSCLSWMESNPVLAEKYANKKHARWWKPHLTGKRLDSISKALVHRVISENRVVSLTGPAAENATANAYVGFVARIIRHGCNLSPKFTHYPPNRGRDRWLTLEEWKRLELSSIPDAGDVFTLALVTGLRQANVIGMEWSWVHGETLLIPAERTKTRQPYGIPLNRTALGVIERRRQAPVRHVKYVLTNKGKPWKPYSIDRQLWGAIKRSGIAEITFHGFRHTFASWLAQRGVSEAVRARLGCWSTRSQADHYSHFDVESLRSYAEIFDTILSQGGAEVTQLPVSKG